MFGVSVVQVLYILIELLTITESAVLKSTHIVELSISPFNYDNVCFIYMGALLFVAHIIVISSCWIDFYHYIMSFLPLFYF